MIKISVLYPNNKNVRFDMGYYIEKHMPLAIKLLSAHPGFKGVSVERGLGGAAPGTDAAYVAMCHFLFDSVENFGAAFEPNASVLQGDIPNYTDVAPVIQLSEVLMYSIGGTCE
ncbi:MAG: EthD family reductase [Acidobacteriota bacterium]|nr:EthD family reductase [Acidobacteriota bacterium]